MTTKNIRDALMKELSDLMDGKADVRHAKAVAKVSAQAIYATRVELENKRMEIELHLNTDNDRMKFIDGNKVKVPTLEF